jgi:hypothetical protein
MLGTPVQTITRGNKNRAAKTREAWCREGDSNSRSPLKTRKLLIFQAQKNPETLEMGIPGTY